MYTKDKESAHDDALIDQWKVFGEGSGFDSKIRRTLNLTEGRRELKDWLNPRQWKKETEEWYVSLSNFTSFVEMEDNESRLSGRASVQNHPEHFMVYMLKKIQEMDHNNSKDYRDWQSQYRRLQELNLGNQSGRRDLSHAITNDMVVCIQEKWVKWMSPNAYKLGSDVLSENIPLPDEKRQNSAFVSRLYVDWLDKEGLVDKATWENGGGSIYASIKSPSSIVKESLLRREDLWPELTKQAHELGEEPTAQADKMMEAWEMIRLLDQVLTKGDHEQVKYWTDIIQEQARKMEHLIRCRIYFDDPDALDQAMSTGLDIVGSYPAEVIESSHGQIGAKQFMAVDSPDAYYRNRTVARNGGASRSGVAIDAKELSFARESAFWFSALGQLPKSEESIPLKLNYLHYPLQVELIGKDWKLARIDPIKPVTGGWVGGSVEMEMRWWEEWNDLHRLIWDRRSSGLELDRDWMPILRQLKRKSREVERGWWPTVRVVDWEKVMANLVEVDREEVRVEMN